MTTTQQGTRDNLNMIMQFDHVIIVGAEGMVTDGPEDLRAPDLMDENLSDVEWEFLDGYSGQQSYSGPIMHNSEYIGGSLARDILARPGYYVAVVAYWSPDEDSEDDETLAEGWAVVYQPLRHADYPHNPGHLHGCQACELGECECDPVKPAGCVSDHCEYAEVSDRH